MGYGFTRLPPGTRRGQQPFLDHVVKTWRFKTKALAKQLGAAGSGLTATEWEHLRAAVFLSDHDLLDDYRACIRPFGIRSNMVTARAFYYSRVIETLCRELLPKPPFTCWKWGPGPDGCSCSCEPGS